MKDMSEFGRALVWISRLIALFGFGILALLVWVVLAA